MRDPGVSSAPAGKTRRARASASTRRATLLFVIALLIQPDPGEAGWQTFDESDGLPTLAVNAILADRSGNYWFGPSSGLVTRYDGARWVAFEPEGVPPFHVSGPAATLQDSSGNLWFGTNEGLLRYIPTFEEWQFFSQADGLSSPSAVAVAEDRTGHLWIGTLLGGANRFDPTTGTWDAYTNADGLASNDVLAVLEDAQGDLWFGTTAGLSRFRPETGAWRTFTEADGLADDLVNWILEDHDGNLWFSHTRYSFGRGVSRFDGTAWTTLSTSDGLADDAVDTIHEDANGRLWFATKGRGVSRFNPATGRWRSFSVTDGLASNFVRGGIEQDASGNLWFGTLSGASRYDGESWRTFDGGNGLAADDAAAITEDHAGDLWFATIGGGVSRFDGSAWTTFTAADGLAADSVFAICEDRSGDYWFGTWGGGVSRFDGVSWTTFGTNDGLVNDTVTCVFQDASDNMWFGTWSGVSRYDGQAWTTFTAADGLGWDFVNSITQDPTGTIWFALEGLPGVSRYDPGTGEWTPFPVADTEVRDIHIDGEGNLWFATYGLGVVRFDGTDLRTYLVADGLSDAKVHSIAQASDGALWFGTLGGGLSRFDPATETWRTFSVPEGLVASSVQDVLVDREGALWAATHLGVSAYDEDRVPPASVLLTRPDSVVASRRIDFGFVAAFEETHMEFQHKLDAEEWSAWTPFNTFGRADVQDGVHTFELRSRDLSRNVEITPVSWTFQIDSAPPVPVIESPAFGEPVRGRVMISGRAADTRFRDYGVEARPTGTVSWTGPEIIVLAVGAHPVASGPLAEWNTTDSPDGRYDLRLTLSDTLGLVGSAIVEVLVDNEEPWASVTSPVLVGSAGGEVFTNASELRLYFPPGAFDGDVLVTISPVADPADSEPLPSGSRCLAAHDVSWGGKALGKTGTLDYALPDIARTRAGPLAVWLIAGNGWVRLGGTADASAGRLSVPLLHEGVYALLEGGNGAMTSDLIVSLSMTPRVFSPHGTFATSEVAISFSLARDANVTAKVYNRAARLVRTIAAGRSMRAGLNVLRWDGRNDGGNLVPDGPYIVTLEALGEMRKETLAVVR